MSVLSVTKDNKIAKVTLNRPPANALASEVIRELSTVLDDLEKDSSTKVIILHGEGRFFSAGADIKEFTMVENPDDFSKLGEEGQLLFDRMEAFPKPIVAAIHGAALGGGLELAMACHMRIVAKGTKLGLPELQLGLIPGFAGTQRLPQLVGVPKATEMLLTSKPIDADDALRLGLANHVVEPDELLPFTESLAKAFAEKSAVSIAFALECLSYARKGQFEEGQRKERHLFGKAFGSHDGQEGIQAFIEKRKPVFKDC